MPASLITLPTELIRRILLIVVLSPQPVPDLSGPLVLKKRVPVRVRTGPQGVRTVGFAERHVSSPALPILQTGNRLLRDVMKDILSSLSAEYSVEVEMDTCWPSLVTWTAQPVLYHHVTEVYITSWIGKSSLANPQGPGMNDVLRSFFSGGPTATRADRNPGYPHTVKELVINFQDVPSASGPAGEPKSNDVDDTDDTDDANNTSPAVELARTTTSFVQSGLYLRDLKLATMLYGGILHKLEIRARGVVKAEFRIAEIFDRDTVLKLRTTGWRARIWREWVKSRRDQALGVHTVSGPIPEGAAWWD